MTRTGYLGSPIRIAAALAVLLPGVPANGDRLIAPAALAFAALLSWIMTRAGWRGPRSRAALLLVPALWLALLLAAHSIVTAGSALELAATFALAALSAGAWWWLERRRAGVLAAVSGSRA